MSRNSINATAIFPLLIVLFSIVSTAWGFSTISPSASGQSPASGQHQQRVTELHVSESSGGDSSEVIARKIIVTGDVDGGYYRSCVKNEGGRFRKLIGTMSPPDGSKKAEILVEGKRNMVDGFIRWCERGNVGLSQKITVESVQEEEPTGLYDDFYVPTGR